MPIRTRPPGTGTIGPVKTSLGSGAESGNDDAVTQFVTLLSDAKETNRSSFVIVPDPVTIPTAIPSGPVTKAPAGTFSAAPAIDSESFGAFGSSEAPRSFNGVRTA